MAGCLFCLYILLRNERLRAENCSSCRPSHCIMGQADELPVIDGVFTKTPYRNSHSVLIIHIHLYLRTVILFHDTE